jgi:hypothetical protein
MTTQMSNVSIIPPLAHEACGPGTSVIHTAKFHRICDNQPFGTSG